jgi:hypothetical protein
LVRPNGDGEQPRDTLATIVPAVASAVLHDDITGLERDFGTVIELETNDSFKHNVVVDRRRAVHPRFVRVGPWRKRGTDKLMELVAPQALTPSLPMSIHPAAETLPT